MKTGSWGTAVPGGIDRWRHLPFNIVVDPKVMKLSVKVTELTAVAAGGSPGNKDCRMWLLKLCRLKADRKYRQPSKSHGAELSLKPRTRLCSRVSSHRHS